MGHTIQETTVAVFIGNYIHKVNVIKGSLYSRVYGTSQAVTWCHLYRLIPSLFEASLGVRLGINCTYCSAVICCCSLRCAARRASIVVIWWISCSTAPIRLAWVRSGAAEVGWIPVEGRKHVEVCLRKSILMSILTQEATESLGKFVPGVDSLSNLLYRY